MHFLDCSTSSYFISRFALSSPPNKRTRDCSYTTTYSDRIGSIKTVELPGPVEVTLAPGENSHNANAASEGFCYEILVETNSKLVFPSAEAWPGSIGDVVPGSEVRAAGFLRMMP